MRKLLVYTTLILLIILAGCNDFSSASSGFDELPVELETLSRGDIISVGESIEIEYSINETDRIIDKLIVTFLGLDGEILQEIVIDDVPVSGWVEPVEVDETRPEGLYSIRFDFYSEEEVYFTDTREFFISSMIGGIRSIASYPPVLYPGGGGLFNAEIDYAGEQSWLRWSLDDEIIAEGAAFEGYSSIEIEAPDSEGVYNLSLEVFPIPPKDGTEYNFSSTVKKDVPLYVNTEQKSSANEFGPHTDFFSLFHFRGNLINSADSVFSGIKELNYTGQPILAVRSGMFGYYLDNAAAFKADKLGLPVQEGVLQGFSAMFSLIPFGIDSAVDTDSELYYAELEDGSLSLFIGILSGGRLEARIKIGSENFNLVSTEPVLFEGVYSSIALAVLPNEEELEMIIYINGEPVIDSVFPSETGEAAWYNIVTDNKEAHYRIGEGSRILLDEFGIYHSVTADGAVVDPNQFKRSMELEYGKNLMYAEGFDGETGELIVSTPEVLIENSSLILPPGAAVDFPPLFPGYEEVFFRIELDDVSSGDTEAVFYVDGENIEIVRLNFSNVYESDRIAAFSLVFSQDAVALNIQGQSEIATGFSEDFSGVGYSIKNNDQNFNLVIKSILVIRKNISISETISGNSGKPLFSGVNSTENKIRS